MFTQIMDFLCRTVSFIPLECMQLGFMQEALIAVLLLAPLAAAAGIQVVNFRMSFFSDAIGHSTFAGIALGLVLRLDPAWTMPVLALIIGFSILFMKHNSRLSSDTVIGVFYSAVAAAGLALVSRNPGIARDMQIYLYGDILTITRGEILYLFLLSCAFFLFQIFAFNRLIACGLNEHLAKTHGIRVKVYENIYIGLLALIVIFAVRSAGVLLVTALLIVPAAAARNFTRSARGMFYVSLIIGTVSGVAGLLLSAQEEIGASSGSMVVLCSCFIFLFSLLFKRKG